MHISASQNNTQPNFGHFLKPKSSVVSYFKTTLENMNPQARAEFVEKMSEVVSKNSKTPIPIETIICDAADKSNGQHFCCVIDGRYSIKNTNASSKSTEILSCMNEAALKADDIHNVNQNMNKIGKIFDMDI